MFVEEDTEHFETLARTFLSLFFGGGRGGGIKVTLSQS